MRGKANSIERAEARPGEKRGNISLNQPQPSPGITELLASWGEGNKEAPGQLTALVYDELRRLAHQHAGASQSNRTLQTTALVHEAYLRLTRQTHPHWTNRAHFFAVAAKAMRQILVNYAVTYKAQKRGGGAPKIELNESAVVSEAQSKEVVLLNEALERLGDFDARKAQVVELKYFGGLNQDEIAEVLRISPRTVQREWRFARAWLHNDLREVG
jgi:RNA polymerase sigma factor (TIGR02999 family)